MLSLTSSKLPKQLFTKILSVVPDKLECYDTVGKSQMGLSQEHFAQIKGITSEMYSSTVL